MNLTKLSRWDFLADALPYEEDISRIYDVARKNRLSLFILRAELLVELRTELHPSDWGFSPFVLPIWETADEKPFTPDTVLATYVPTGETTQLLAIVAADASSTYDMINLCGKNTLASHELVNASTLEMIPLTLEAIEKAVCSWNDFGAADW